jgi:hypothetical protein
MFPEEEIDLELVPISDRGHVGCAEIKARDIASQRFDDLKGGVRVPECVGHAVELGFRPCDVVERERLFEAIATTPAHRECLSEELECMRLIPASHGHRPDAVECLRFTWCVTISAAQGESLLQVLKGSEGVTAVEVDTSKMHECLSF